MSERITVVEEDEISQDAQAILNGLRRILLAGVGAATVAQEEAERFVKKLVARGTIAEQDGRNLLTEFAQKRQEKAAESRQRVEVELEQRMAALLHKMNIPTHNDIQALTQKVAALSQAVDELKNRR